ncbi:aminoacyl-tRNA deacylase [Mycetocola spongiae]|uniref:aminoacyl-tRNA deacylase n=1 Tax=Mycetocola spongiae TaxID=2859226 RepID=UPI001CF44187|nr:YbaK/EbsC family protein [Mycetocola spongiae]UCR87911.1 YbaK/EbsC family protein [Mycetocola spongiae]
MNPDSTSPSSLSREAIAGLPEGTRRVLDAAARLGLDAEVRERAAAGSLAEAAALMGIPTGSLVKTLVVRRHDGSYLLALIPGGRKISWAKLRTAVGVNRLSLPSAELALEATGFERGTITPLGSHTDWPIFADAGLGALAPGARIGLGAGAHGYGLMVEAAPLLAATGAILADISDPEESA